MGLMTWTRHSRTSSKIIAKGEDLAKVCMHVWAAELGLQKTKVEIAMWKMIQHAQTDLQGAFYFEVLEQYEK